MTLNQYCRFILIFILIFSVFYYPARSQELVSEKYSLEEGYNKAILAYYQPSPNAPSDKVYKSFLVFHNNYEPAYRDLVQIYQERGYPALALEFVQNLIESGPNPETYKPLAFILAVQAGRYAYAETLQSYAKGNPELIFYNGFLHYQQQNYPRAIILFQQALQSSTAMPQAYHFLGMSYMAQKKYAQAIKSFLAALKLEPSFMLSLEPLADSYLAMGNWRRALSTLRRAYSNLPEKKSLQKTIDSITNEHKSEIEQEQQTRKERKTTADVPQISTFAKIPGRPVRVGLSERLTSIFLKTGATYKLTLNGEVKAGLKGDIIHIYTQGQKSDDGLATKSFALKNKDVLTIEYASNGATTTVFDMTDGQGYFFVKTADRSYRGSMQVLGFSQGLTLVNTVPLEEYLYSVVPSEIPPYWPVEALKAQAVAARTYTLVNMGRFAQRGFDLFGSIVSHAYTGISGENARTTQAVNDTAGLVLYTDKNKKNLLTTYYSANTGGYTDPEGVVWNLTTPSQHVGRADKLERVRAKHLPPSALMNWIKSRPKTYSNWPGMYFPAAFRSVVWITAEEMALRIGRSKKIGNVKEFQVIERSISGRVTRIRAIGDSGSIIISGDLIRNRLGGLRSNLFLMNTITDDKNKLLYFVIYTAGWGHGIGMDQSGAAGMAADGHNFHNILTHYYAKGVLSNYVYNKEK